jgi:hypothetical protein
MYRSTNMIKVGLVIAISAGLLLSGCATTSPDAAFRQALPKDQRLDVNAQPM